MRLWVQQYGNIFLINKSRSSPVAPQQPQGNLLGLPHGHINAPPFVDSNLNTDEVVACKKSTALDSGTYNERRNHGKKKNIYVFACRPVSGCSLKLPRVETLHISIGIRRLKRTNKYFDGGSTPICNSHGRKKLKKRDPRP